MLYIIFIPCYIFYGHCFFTTLKTSFYKEPLNNGVAHLKVKNKYSIELTIILAMLTPKLLSIANSASQN